MCQKRVAFDSYIVYNAIHIRFNDTVFTLLWLGMGMERKLQLNTIPKLMLYNFIEMIFNQQTFNCMLLINSFAYIHTHIRRSEINEKFVVEKSDWYFFQVTSFIQTNLIFPRKKSYLKYWKTSDYPKKD